jgi:hypothetical protein
LSQIVEAKPESVGPLSQRLARIKPWMERCVADGKLARRAGGDRGAQPHSILRQGRPERRLGLFACVLPSVIDSLLLVLGEVAEASLPGPSAREGA